MRGKVLTGVERAHNDLELQMREFYDKESQYFKFMLRLSQEHRKSLDKQQVEVFGYALVMYRTHLEELEKKDIDALHKLLAELKRVKEEMLRQLDTEATTMMSLRKYQEDINEDASPLVIALRKECDFLSRELQEMKDSFKDP